MICDTIFRAAAEKPIWIMQDFLSLAVTLDGIDAAVFEKLSSRNMRFQSNEFSINVATLEPVTCYKSHRELQFSRSTSIIRQSQHLTIQTRGETQQNAFSSLRNSSISFSRKRPWRFETSLPCTTLAFALDFFSDLKRLIGFSSLFYKTAYQGQTLIFHTPNTSVSFHSGLITFCKPNDLETNTQTHWHFCAILSWAPRENFCPVKDLTKRIKNKRGSITVPTFDRKICRI